MTTLVLASVGLAALLKYGTPTRIRWPKKLFECGLCLGFWSGVLVAAYHWTQTGELLPPLPFISAGAAFLFDAVIDLIDVAADRLES